MGREWLRCLSCICAGCPLEDTCEIKPCDSPTNVYECTNVSYQCDIYGSLSDSS